MGLPITGQVWRWLDFLLPWFLILGASVFLDRVLARGGLRWRVYRWPTPFELGLRHYAQGDYRSAIISLTKAAQLAEKFHWGSNLARCAYYLGLINYELRRIELAREWLGKSIQFFESRDNETVLLCHSLTWLSHTYIDQREFNVAEQLLVRVQKIVQDSSDEGLLAGIEADFGFLYYSRKDQTRAEELYAGAISKYERIYGSEDAITVTILNNLAKSYMDQGKHKDAEPLLEKVVACWSRTLPSGHPRIAKGLMNLAEAKLGLEKLQQAEPLLHEALAIQRQQLGPDHPDTKQSTASYALVLERLGKYEQAELVRSGKMVLPIRIF